MVFILNYCSLGRPVESSLSFLTNINGQIDKKHKANMQINTFQFVDCYLCKYYILFTVSVHKLICTLTTLLQNTHAQESYFLTLM